MKKKKLIVLILCIFVGCILVLSALYLTGVINVKNIRAYRPSNSAVRAVENQSENFAGGKGTEQDPYLIETSSHLFRLSELVNAQYSNNPYREAFYRQTTDIDLSENGKKWIPIGETYGTGNRIGPFEGNYNGDNHSISGMEINYTDSITESLRYCFGVFGQIGSNGAVENLHIKNSHITVEADTTDYCGAIAGACDGRIVNCHVGDDVTINSQEELPAKPVYTE